MQPTSARETINRIGRIWSIPASVVHQWSRDDGAGSEIQMVLRVAAGGVLSSAVGWNPDDPANEPTLALDIRDLGDRSALRDNQLAAEYDFEFPREHKIKTIWGVQVYTASGSPNDHFYHSLNADPAILLTCSDRWPNYTGPFFPQCNGYQRAWDHAALTYFIAERFFADIPVLNSCIRQLIDDLSRPLPSN